MNVTYGSGIYIEKKVRIEGEIILSDHKVFLSRDGQDLSDTYVPLEKVEYIKLSSNQLVLHVRPAIMSRFQAIFQGDKKNIHDLAYEIINRRGLKKKFLKNEWFEEPA